MKDVLFFIGFFIIALAVIIIGVYITVEIAALR